jgi:peptidyl-prolyl cis-trans isomerase SurA
LHQAALDSIEVSESMVMNQVEQRLNFFISQIGSRERLEEYWGKSFNEIREDQRELVRNQMLTQRVHQNIIGDINATPAEVRRFFNSLPKDSIPIVPTMVELQIISVEPPIPLEEINRTKERLRDFSERVNNGTTDFALLARMYSECPSSARGGELGFMGRGQLVPEFAAVAFNLTDPSRVSRVVETENGFHIIQLIERRGERINTRHILLRPRISAENRNRAMQNMDSVAGLIRTERMTFEQAVVVFSQDRNTALNAGLMLNERTGTSRFEYQHLPSDVARVVYDMNVGEISRPFTMINPQTNREVVAIVRLRSRIETHTANLQEDYQMLKALFEERRGEEVINEWIRNKQRETYINIDPAWSNCEFQFPGWIK